MQFFACWILNPELKSALRRQDHCMCALLFASAMLGSDMYWFSLFSCPVYSGPVDLRPATPYHPAKVPVAAKPCSGEEKT